MKTAMDVIITAKVPPIFTFSKHTSFYMLLQDIARAGEYLYRESRPIAEKVRTVAEIDLRLPYTSSLSPVSQ